MVPQPPARRARTGSGPAVPADYDADPGRFAANQAATSRFHARADIHADVHDDVAARLAEHGCRRVVDIGGGNGTLAKLLAARGVATVVVDRARYVSQAPRPAVRADALRLPFPDNTFDGAAALWMLYHLTEPAAALAEARRVLRPGGLLAVSAPSRRNDPELAPVMPRWGRPISFDAENGPGILATVFDTVEPHHWDTPSVRLPDRRAVALYLRGRGFSEEQARHAATLVSTPLAVTKRGLLAWAHKAPR